MSQTHIDTNRAVDEVISSYQLGSTTVLTGAGGTHTLRSVLIAAVSADRALREAEGHDVADRIVHENYGPDGDAEVYREAIAISTLATAQADVDSKTLLAGALALGHLDADGILALIREAAR